MRTKQKATLKTQILSAVRKANSAQTVTAAVAWRTKADQLKARMGQ